MSGCEKLAHFTTTHAMGVSRGYNKWIFANTGGQYRLS